MRQRRPFEGKEQAASMAYWRRAAQRLAQLNRESNTVDADDLEADRLADEEQDRYEDRD